MDIRPSVERNLLPFQIRNRPNIGILRDQNRLPCRVRWFIPNVNERNSGSLREDGRGLSCVTQIDASSIERFEELRTRGEKKPLYMDPFGCQQPIEHPLSFHHIKTTVFLVTN